VLAVILVVLGIIGLGEVSRVQVPQTTLLPYLVAVYSVGAHAERPAAVVGLVSALAGVLVDEAEDFVVLGPLSVATWLVGRLVRSWRGQAMELTRLAGELERQRAETARHAVAEERARIARDLHDVVGHHLSLLVLQAGAERLALGSDGAGSRDVLSAIEQTGRATLAELRRLVGVLREDTDAPALAPLPGVGQLPRLLEQVRTAGVRAELRVEGDPVALPPGLDVTAYRIVQEALTNVLRHASGATEVTVLVRYGDRDLALEVADDGRSSATGEDGHGLIGMRERVSLYSGELTAGPRDGGGYAIRASLPVGSLA
jgi:signal transduction histidine kinase